MVGGVEDETVRLRVGDLLFLRMPWIHVRSPYTGQGERNDSTSPFGRLCISSLVVCAMVMML